ncbi:hypothetical protein [Kutzneria buriramensis]|uniref:TrbL/VirB6 plasmid conjugal transfer protein n=1 Tax=Kutzneria buriramensis TaxID=1045776 RepID=A0A3E0GWG8_9PSEU|nr:hypothetical protein [Kutzneria buriramensis]REH31025.1 hypothetical protein BCF44_12248 [Kutzneria buriramensis]
MALLPHPAPGPRRQSRWTVLTAAGMLALVCAGVLASAGAAAADPVPVPLPVPTPSAPVATAPPPGIPLIPVPGTSTAAAPPASGTPAAPGTPDICKDPAMQNLPMCLHGLPTGPPAGSPPGTLPTEVIHMPGEEFNLSGSGGVMPTLLGSGGADFTKFDIGYDPGNIFTGSADEWFFGMLTRLAFSLHTWLVGVNTWLVDQALGFSIAGFLLGPVNALAATWKGLVVDRLGLPQFAMVATAFVGGTLILSGRLAHGLTEMATSLIAGAVFVVILANPSATLLGDNGLLGKAKSFSLQTAAVVLSDNPNQQQVMDYQVADPLITGLGYALVVEPHMILDWGKSLDDPQHPDNNCLAEYQMIVDSGPHGTDNSPRDRMRDAGCGSLADFNAKATPERLIGVVLVTGGSLILIVLLALMSCSLALAQVILAGMVVAAPFACVSAYAPRGGRNVLWWWCVTVAAAVLLVVLTLVGLAVYIRLIIGIFQASNDSSLIMRFVVFDMVVLLGFLLHRKIKRMAGRAAHSLIGKLARTASGGGMSGGLGGYGGYGGGGMAPWAAAGAGLASGVALRHMMFEGRQEWRSATRPLKRLTRFGRRGARRLARTAPGKAAIATLRQQRQRLVNTRKAAFRKIKTESSRALQTGAIYGSLLAGEAGQAASAAAARRHRMFAARVNPPKFPRRPGNPGYRTPDGVAGVTVTPRPGTSAGGLRPGGIRPGARGPVATRAAGPVPRRETPHADAAVRSRLARQLADKRAREAASRAETRAGGPTPHGTSRLGIRHTTAEADQILRNAASVTTGHNVPYGSAAGVDRAGRTRMRPSSGANGGQVPGGGSSRDRRARLRGRLNPPNV